MMKKLSKLALLAAAAAFLVAALSACSSGSGDDDTTQGNIDKNPSTSTVVNAVWNFATQPTGFQTDDSNALDALKLSPTSGGGATLTVTGRWKWATEYLQAQSSSGKTVSEAAGWTSTSSGKFLTLTLEDDASVTVVYSGSGALANTRWVAILDGNNTVKFSTPADGIGSDSKGTKTISLTKGTYTIAANAARIYSITCAQGKEENNPPDKDDGAQNDSNNNEAGDGGNEEEPEEVTPTIGVNLDADFTTFDAATVCAQDSTVPVRLGDTDFFAVSGSGGKVIALETKDKSIALTFGGTGGERKNAVFFYARKGTATVTVTYYQSNAGRYVKVLNAGMDTTEVNEDKQTDTSNTRKTREIDITIGEDLTPVYIGSANSGIYIASIKVEYKD